MSTSVKRFLLTISDLFRKIEIKIAISAVFGLSLIPFDFGRYEKVAGAVADAGHFWFYFLAFIYLDRALKIPRNLLFGLIVTSGVIEIIQPYVERDGNFQDFAVSSLGAICGFIVRQNYPLISKVVVTLIFSIPLFFPILWRIDALRFQEQFFPELADFKTKQWSSLWEATAPDDGPSSTLYVSPNGNLVVRAIAQKEWPGILYSNQFLPWKNYGSLEIEIETFEDNTISIRIDDDQKCKEFDQRFNKSFFLKTGVNKISIPLDEVRLTRSGRMMNLDKIKRVAIFTTKRERPERIFAIKAMRLIKSG